MEFFNDKEEVIHFELTSYGRHLLSLGRLKPQFYAFYDDDVLYEIAHQEDSSGNPDSETQAATKKRILEETPYLKAQSNYFGLDKKILSEETYLNFSEIRYPSSIEKINTLNYPLASSNQFSGKRAPSWELTYLHGTTLSGTVSHVKKFLESGEQFTNPSSANYNKDARLSGSLPYKNIPQLEMTLNHELSVRNIHTDDEDYVHQTSPNLPVSEIKSDGSYISVKEDQILIHFLENHGFSHKDSYTIEVFMYDDVSHDKFLPLEFEKRNLNQLNPEYDYEEFDDVAGDSPPLDTWEAQLGQTSSRYVEYYFDLRVDRDIPEDDICSGVMRLKKEDIFLDLDYGCLEREQAKDVNIYNTGITNNDIEDCD